MNAASPPASVRAAALQMEASDPAVSAFVAASAGSGKTKLLIDRLLRLMLADPPADPGRILCLTFTKAAAAEMAIRLQKVLGAWVTMAEADLTLALAALDVPASRAPDARALFARVLDLPGGMRIGTIHAFCQSLLRRFPLEASLAPHFHLLEDADSRTELETARAEALEGADPKALATLAGLVSDKQYGALVAGLRTHQERLAPLLRLGPEMRLARLRRAAGVTGDDAAAVIVPQEAALKAALERAQAHGSEAVRKKAAALWGWLNLPHELRAESWGEWLKCMLTAAGEPRQPGGFGNDKWAKGDPDFHMLCAAEAERVAGVEDMRRAARVVEVTDALLSLAGPVLARFNQRKALAGLLDYDDLIRRTGELLLDPGTAWVLFKLDGGLDHLLLDEVQDTAPSQWEIAGALTAEFFNGESANEHPRTVFAVGDRKQSIYSFQGADPAAFDRWRDIMRTRAAAAGAAFRDTAVDISFRSTTPVLGLVDAVFADPQAAAGVTEPGKLHHVAHRAGHAGQVELWPLAPTPDALLPAPWAIAASNQGLATAPQRLADELAAWIEAQAGGGVMLDSRGRPLAPGDVLVLVRRRNDFARMLVRKLKARGVPVAGLDRLFLTDQPAVQDLMALCDTLLLPQDDLSLACVLTSPLGGLTDDDLMHLAIGRAGRLWTALRERAGERPVWQRAWDFLSALLTRTDYASPHSLLSEALGPLGGRARLLARLGPEAAEPMDEMLNAALAYARAHPASLQGFLHWLRRSGAEVTRVAEEAGSVVRVMTVHGAKGLQAPLVILPDTTSLPPYESGPVWVDKVPLWSPRKELRCAATEDARRRSEALRLEEYNRQLYVALTRAEDRLVVCGWQTRKALPDACWYNLVACGMAALPVESVPGPWQGEILVHAAPQTTHPARHDPVHSEAGLGLPAWAGSAPHWRPAPIPLEPARAIPLAPSRPDDAALGPVPPADSPVDAEGAMARGTLIHRLLQHLPSVPPAARAKAMRAHLARIGQPASVAAEIMAVLDHPELRGVFGPEGRAEAPLIGEVGGVVVTGQVDRLAVLPDGVTIVDFKTNRTPPGSAAETPVRYLRQMAAYRAVLQRIYPDRSVKCALVWTRLASVMVLPAALLDRYAPGGVDRGLVEDHVQHRPTGDAP
jgi:ATP-dependent helicase/nuclease subunit A